jgi:hypothetical protein
MTMLKGALVSFTNSFLPIPVPDVTVFQFNPESLTHTWSQPVVGGESARPGTEAGNPMAVAGMPGEQFSLTVVLDANEDIADGGASGALASVSGVYPRLAAMEMLLYPPGSGTSSLLGQATAALGLGGGGGSVTRSVPDSAVPVTLFVWGPLRILPVRLTALTITETLYDATLNPVQAEAKVELKVLTPTELEAVPGDVLAKLGTVAYNYTLSVRQAAAVANLANAAQSIIGMLPH